MELRLPKVFPPVPNARPASASARARLLPTVRRAHVSLTPRLRAFSMALTVIMIGAIFGMAIGVAVAPGPAQARGLARAPATAPASVPVPAAPSVVAGESSAQAAPPLTLRASSVPRKKVMKTGRSTRL
jgi:hypothetical protein